MIGRIVAIGLICLGAVVVVGEVAYVQYFSGHTISAARVFDQTGSQEPHSVTIDEADLPLRVVLKATGKRDRQDRLGRPYADVMISYGDEVAPQTVRFTYSSEDEVQFQGVATKTQSFALNAPAGTFPISMTPGDYHQLRITGLDATFRGGGRSMSWAILALGALLFVGGLAAFRAKTRAG
ncbi:MAG: hypothetical protein AAF340_08285 [Pseudomonadota bacterium]